MRDVDFGLGFSVRSRPDLQKSIHASCLCGSIQQRLVEESCLALVQSGAHLRDAVRSFKGRRERRAQNGRMYCLRTKSSTSRKLRPLRPVGRVRKFSLMVWKCFGEYLRADSEQRVENEVWKASTKANAE
jgi:hypothetical protein